MDIDVLLPFHRNDSFLQEAIESIRKSSEVDLRIIAIDDRLDQSIDISSLFSNFKRFEILRTGGGEGYGTALKLGTMSIESDICALMNSDDLVHPDRFKTQIRSLEKAELSFTKMQRISQNGRFLPALGGEISGPGYDPIMLLFGSFGANASWCMRTEWWKKNAFFDTKECLDWRIGFRTFGETSITMINRNLYFYRRHGYQTTANRNVSIEAMDPVYQCWDNFARSLGLTENSRQVFETLATPWNFKESTDYSHIISWLQGFQQTLESISPENQKSIIQILNRRMLIAAVSERRSPVNASKFLLAGRADLIKFMKDLIGFARI